MKKLLLSLCAMALIGQTQAVQVEAEGRAAGDQKTAREQALADALREAVRKGTGVDVLASSGVSNFALDFDRILSSAFGHVKSYEVISSRLGPDQIYTVKVRADVEKGTPDAKNTLALRELMQRKGAPRVAIRIRERLLESDGDASLQHVLEDAAKGLQFFVVDPASRADFVIEGEVAMKYLGRETLHGRPPQHSFAATGTIRAVRGDTGEVIAVDNLSGKNSVGGTAFAKEDAAREALDLVARPDGNAEAPPTILNKILARWVTETDLGAMKRLEFTGISSEDFQKIQTDFADTEKISAVWPREFDSQGISILDVETRLDNIGLGQEVTKATSGRSKLDRSTENLIAFNSSGTGTASPTAQGDAKSDDKPWWKVWQEQFLTSATACRRNRLRTISRANMANSPQFKAKPSCNQSVTNRHGLKRTPAVTKTTPEQSAKTRRKAVVFFETESQPPCSRCPRWSNH